MKDFDYVNNHSVNPLYLIVSEVDGYIEEKMEINSKFLLLQIKTKKYWKNTQNFGMGFKKGLKQ